MHPLAFSTNFLNPVLALLLFGLALAVRLPGLDLFLTADEPLWVARSQQFLAGLTDPDYRCSPLVRQGREIDSGWLGCTFQTVHPGVTTMWTGSLGFLYYYVSMGLSDRASLSQFVQQLGVEPVPAALIRPVRLPTVLITSAFIAMFFLLSAGLLNRYVAFIAGLMLALDPLHSALSRVLHHDALATTFMTLSLLTMVAYLAQGRSLPWLLLSGACAGLGFLSKSLAIYLLPYLCLCGIFWLVWRQQWRMTSAWLRLVANIMLWLLAAGLVYILLFPAMWLIPGEVLHRLLFTTREIVDSGHSHLFLGEFSQDPGWLFYPLGLWARLSVPVVLGLVSAAAVVMVKLLGHNRFRNLGSMPPTTSGIWLSLLAYLFFFVVMLSLADKKLDRYLLPVFPVLSLIAAQGLLWLVRPLAGYFATERAMMWATAGLAGLIVIIQGWFIWCTYPYYSTYHSPFIGGISGAARLMTVSEWGEGQDQAAAYLNQKAMVETLSVANAGHETFAPFFRGISKDYSYTNGNTLSEDYVVISARQMQIEKINPAFAYYVQHHYHPEYKVDFEGVDYFYIYALPIEHHVRWKDNQVADKATLFGYRLEGDQLRLYWQYEGLPPGEGWWLGLEAAAGGDTIWQPCALDPAFSDEAEQPEAILESACPLYDNLPAGLYQMQVGLGTEAESLTLLPLSEGTALWQLDGTGEIQVVEQP